MSEEKLRQTLFIRNLALFSAPACVAKKGLCSKKIMGCRAQPSRLFFWSSIIVYYIRIRTVSKNQAAAEYCFSLI